jgi:uroporphyrinogen-III synthase
LREVLTTRPVHAIVFADAGEVRGLAGALDAEERSTLGTRVLVAAGDATAAALARWSVAPAIRTDDGAPEAVAWALRAALGGPSHDAGA